MYGYITWTDALRRPSAGEYEVMKMRMCRVAIPGRKGLPQFVKRGMAVRAARLLRECGITRAVFPELFPYLDIFAQYRIAPADPMGVYRVLAGRLVQARLDACGQSGKGIAVAVCAKKLTEEVRRTVTELCIRNRYVMLVSPEQDDGFCRKREKSCCNQNGLLLRAADCCADRCIYVYQVVYIWQQKISILLGRYKVYSSLYAFQFACYVDYSAMGKKGNEVS